MCNTWHTSGWCVHTYFHAVLCVGVVKDESSLNSLEEEEEEEQANHRRGTNGGQDGRLVSDRPGG